MQAKTTPTFDTGVRHIATGEPFPRWPIPSLYPGVEHGPLTAFADACQRMAIRDGLSDCPRCGLYAPCERHAEA